MRKSPVAQAGIQIFVSLAYLLVVWRWRPFVPQPVKLCGGRVRVDAFNFAETASTLIILALQIIALGFAHAEARGAGATPATQAVCVGAAVVAVAFGVFLAARVWQCARHSTSFGDAAVADAKLTSGERGPSPHQREQSSSVFILPFSLAVCDR